MMPGRDPRARSPEREKLAEAITKHNNATDRLARLRTALAQASEDSIDASMIVSDRERELAEAEQASPANLAMVALGEIAPLDTGSLVEQAERRLAEAKDVHRQKRELRAALEGERNEWGVVVKIGEIEAQGRRAAITEMNLDAAIRAVLAAEPEPLALIAEAQSALAALSAVVAALEFLGGVRLPREHDWVFILASRIRAAVQATLRPLPETEQLAPAWQAALEGLRRDADTELPAIPVGAR
jgi:hypothetical protein